MKTLFKLFPALTGFSGQDKPHGTIRYYRYPNTMQRNIDDAVKLYSGDKPQGLLVDKLEKNLHKLNGLYCEIEDIFKFAGYPNFEKNPNDKASKRKFAKTFIIFNAFLEAARIQGFKWKQLEYEFEHQEGNTKISMLFDEKKYLILVLRYKELFNGSTSAPQKDDVPYEIDSCLTEIDTGKIDNDYMNSRFEKYKKDLEQPNLTKEQLQNSLDELHKSFAVLTQEEQKYANIFLNDIECGNIKLEIGKTFKVQTRSGTGYL